MLSHEMVAAGMEEDGKTPGIAEGDDLRFSWVIANVQDLKVRDEFSRFSRLIYSFPFRCVQY